MKTVFRIVRERNKTFSVKVWAASGNFGASGFRTMAAAEAWAKSKQRGERWIRLGPKDSLISAGY
jgi:hypothetical protein